MNKKCEQFGILNGGVYKNMYESDRRVFGTYGLAPTVRAVAGMGGNKELKIAEEQIVSGADRTGGRGSVDRHSWDLVTEPVICASRGRNPDNPSDRTAGCDTEQRIEFNESGTSNCLSTVQKDNYVAEPCLVGGIGKINFGTQFRQGNRVYDSDCIGMCLNAQPVGNAGGNSYLYTEPLKYIKESTNTVSMRRKTESGDYCVQGKVFAKENSECGTTILANQRAGVVHINGKSYRIRKLTPRECWRLMDYSDEDFNKAAAMGTAEQHLYKQAGNGIVVACLEGIYNKLLVNTELTEPKQLSLF